MFRERDRRTSKCAKDLRWSQHQACTEAILVLDSQIKSNQNNLKFFKMVMLSSQSWHKFD
jgi:hypothetical protein